MTIGKQPGELAAAVKRAARANGLDLGEVRAGPGDEAMMSSPRGRIVISPRGESGPFAVFISHHDTLWSSGEAESPDVAAKVADAWLRGSTLEQLRTKFPFMEYSQLGLAYEAGDPASYRWQTLLQDDDLTAIRQLLKAAYAEPRLRALMPTVSHLTLLRLTTDYRDPSAMLVFIERKRDHVYRVWSISGDSTVESRSVAEPSMAAPPTGEESAIEARSVTDAVSAAVSLLPAARG